MSSFGNNVPRRNYRPFNNRNKNNYSTSVSANHDSFLSYSGINNKSNRWRSSPTPNKSKSFDNYRQRLPSTSSTSSASSGSTCVSSTSRKPNCNNQSTSSFNHKQGKSEKPAKSKICVFCKKNREPREFYSSHTVKDEAGNTTCPILFKYTCELCGATGPESHSRSYCLLANVAKGIFDDATAYIQFNNFAVQSKAA